MKKQRWRKTKPKMKKWLCDSCSIPIKVIASYEPEYCCRGYKCGCYGLPINPIFCDKCVKELFGEPVKKGGVNLDEFF